MSRTLATGHPATPLTFPTSPQFTVCPRSINQSRGRFRVFFHPASACVTRPFAEPCEQCPTRLLHAGPSSHPWLRCAALIRLLPPPAPLLTSACAWEQLRPDYLSSWPVNKSWTGRLCSSHPEEKGRSGNLGGNIEGLRGQKVSHKRGNGDSAEERACSELAPRAPTERTGHQWRADARRSLNSKAPSRPRNYEYGICSKP